MLCYHVCNARIARYEAGGMAGVVFYGHPTPTGAEIHNCPQCGQILADADLFAIREEQHTSIVEAIDGQVRMSFPYLMKYGHRAYTFASVDRSEPSIARLVDGEWHKRKMDLPTFTRWMLVLGAR